MKAIAILWNSMGEYFSDALKDIKQFSTIQDCFKINFNNRFKDFISDIYPYKGDQKWKLDYKINIMNNKYTKNEVLIMFLEVPDSEKIYIERKKTYIYKNIEELKKIIRSKYEQKILNYSFDNVFHMTDDETEYLETLQIIKKHLIISFVNNSGYMKLNDYLYTNKKFVEKNEQTGKRDKFWFADNMFMYKNVKENSYELYSELFVDEVANILGLKCAKYIPTIYNDSKGITTLNFVDDNQVFVDGSHIIDFNLSGICSENLISPMETIYKHNNLEIIPKLLKNYCFELGIIYSDKLIEDLKKIFVFDTILLQSDRNPNNWGILIDRNSRVAEIAPLYDNSNMMGMNKDIGVISNLKLEDVYCFATALVPNAADSFFSYKLNLIENICDSSIVSIYEDYLEKFKAIDIDTIFYDIEIKNNIAIPDDFKEIAYKFLNENILNLSSIIESKEKVKILIK